LKTLRAIYDRYSGAIFKVLAPLGLFGVFAIAFIDSAALGMPLDPVVAAYVYGGRASLFSVAGYVTLAAAGSALGSSVIYIIGKKGGEAVLHARMSPEGLERMRKRFEEREFITLMVTSMLPPPTPFKLFLISAAAFQMGFVPFLLSIFVGRVIRFTILSVLVVRFGPQVANAMGSLLRNHLLLSLAVFVAGVALLFAWMLMRRRRPIAQ
jgi:membrane protein YqaA with SNARE-associated domain